MSLPPDAAVGRVGRVWILAVCGYSLLRALLAWPLLAHYGVNPGVFLVLDVATAYPLALGQVRIVGGFRSQDFAAVQGWCAVASAALLVPYAYLFVVGHAHMPGYATALLAGLVAVMATASILRLRQQCLGCDEAAFEPALALADD